jgi:hypothetical protein
MYTINHGYLQDEEPRLQCGLQLSTETYVRGILSWSNDNPTWSRVASRRKLISKNFRHELGLETLLRLLAPILARQVTLGTCSRGLIHVERELWPTVRRQRRRSKKPTTNKPCYRVLPIQLRPSHSAQEAKMAGVSVRKTCSPSILTSSTGRTMMRPSYVHTVTRNLTPALEGNTYSRHSRPFRILFPESLAKLHW